MKILLDCAENSNKHTAVALGNFDGVHLGHQYLIEKMINRANEKGLVKTVFTFNNSSLVQFKTNKKNNILLSNEQKITLFENMGVELLYLVDFTDKLMRMPPYEFVKSILVKSLKAKLVVVGFDFKFGYKAQGNGEFLKQVGKEFDFEVEIIEPVTKNNKIVSSSYIRELISIGNIKEANLLLGRPFAISGVVVRGKGRGRGLGFATANLELDINYQVPKFGVYRTYTHIDGKKYLSVTNIGKNPTFDDVGFSIETHIIDFDENIYGKKVAIQLIDFIREEIKFDDLNELREQVLNDIEKVKKI